MRHTTSLMLLASSATFVATAATAQVASDPSARQGVDPAQQAPGNQPAPAGQDTPATANTEAPGAQPAAADLSLNEVVVTGNTSGKRTLFTSSSDVTLANSADIQRLAPRSTAEALNLVPGVFVEGTAGPVSNNYSVRGLRGGAQTFITLEEDGMPILYSGGGADEYFQNDITIDRLEAVEGGTSGILAVNGAAATINFISLKPNFDHVTSSARFTGTTYGDIRADGYFSAPIAPDLAFSVGGFVDSNPGQRYSQFNYNTYHVKGMLEKRFGDGGFLRLTIKKQDEHDAYYADMPFTSNGNGQIGNVAGLNGLNDNITGGRAFSQIKVPDSCATGNCVRTFSTENGIHTRSTEYRGDLNLPITQNFSAFARARYLDAVFDFNGTFPGSNGQPPASAVTYLTSAASPIASLLTAGRAAFPTATQFGLRDTLTGQVIAANNTGALNALNGNGLLQETVLNHQTTRTKDLGTDFGVKWDYTGGAIENSLTVGGMFYDVRRADDQSGVASLINGVANASHIYDVVALNAAGGVAGQLTNNGMVSYGNWGQGIFNDHVDSLSGYFNDELKIGENLHIDFGFRYEHEHVATNVGNAAAVNGTVLPGTPGIVTDLGPTFNGTYTPYRVSYHDTAETVGVNYTLNDHLALYGRYAKGFQTNGGNSGGPASAPSDLTLYEGGVRFQFPGLVGSLVGFRTEFRDQSYTFTNPSNPAIQNNALADDNINGVQLDVDFKPVRFFSISASGVYQDPSLTNLRFNGTAQPQYDGNTPERTPKKLFQVTPSFILPQGLGEIYGRWRYTGRIFADAGDGVALPAYDVFSVGASVNLSKHINLNVSVDNLTNKLGLTEGNPRQGQTQSIINGYFYGRAIIGRNALGSVTFKF
ncbi:MAG: TonB-dependent receptor domain-containing protein [Janthinobacterium lividum]